MIDLKITSDLVMLNTKAMVLLELEFKIYNLEQQFYLFENKFYIFNFIEQNYKNIE